MTKEEYDVYTAAFKDIYTQGFERAQYKTYFVVLDSNTEPDFAVLERNLANAAISSSIYKKNQTREFTPSIFEVLLKDFKEKNRQLAKVERKFPIDYEYKIVSKCEIDELLKVGENQYQEILKSAGTPPFFGSRSAFIWQPFRKKYPNASGYYNLSRVGFSEDNKFALVYLNLEGGDHGSSKFYILEKTEDLWQVRVSFGSGFVND